MGSRLPTQIRENQPHARTPNGTQSQGLASKGPGSPSSALSERGSEGFWDRGPPEAKREGRPSIHNQTGTAQELRPRRQCELRSHLVTDSPAPTFSEPLICRSSSSLLSSRSGVPK